ncbi:MAG TPA: response regulator transcription factor [Tepidisphaeraceae bacterium]|nr:response regulator transcription factor [Tepidisphaeraceae bacterium]
MRILLVDDHQILRQGLLNLLHQHQDLKVVGQAGDGRSAVQMARELVPDVVVMDIAMPGLNGIDATRQLALAHPAAKVIALSMHVDRRFAEEMLRAGAKAYLVKDGAFEELASAIRTVLEGRIYLSPRVAGGEMDQFLHRDGGGKGDGGDGDGRAGASPARSAPSAFARLSPREREVLQLMSEGRATKEIATDLGVSVKTIETHRRQLMEKLNLYSVAELTKYAVREGLTTLDN